MNIEKLKAFFSTPAPSPVYLTLRDTSSFAVGDLLTIHTYDQSPLSRFLQWAFDISPPTNNQSLRITRIIGKSQLSLEQVEC